MKMKKGLNCQQAGSMGGKMRAKKMTKLQKKEAAKKAAEARWKK